MRRALIVLAAALALAACDREKLARWCDTYQRGHAYVDSLVLPALDMAASANVAPAWGPAFEAARATLTTVDAALSSLCEGIQTGKAPDEHQVGELVAQGAEAMQELIHLHQALTHPPRPMGIMAAPDVPPAPPPPGQDIAAELAKLEAEARRAR